MRARYQSVVAVALAAMALVAALVSPHRAAYANTVRDADVSTTSTTGPTTTSSSGPTTTTSPTSTTSTTVALSPPGPPGYWVVGSDGGVFRFGAITYAGSAAPLALPVPFVAAAGTRSGHGYWLATTDGGVFTFGDATFFGSAAGAGLPTPAVALLPTRTERGYWIVTAGGAVMSFGDAASLPAVAGPAPIVAAAATPSGKGLWLADIAGAVHPIGDAVVLPRPDGGPQSARPLVAIVATPSGKGYWLAYTDGSIASVGDAPPLGSLAGIPLVAPIVGMVTTPDGKGLLLTGDDGGVFRLGQAPFFGSAAQFHPAAGSTGVILPGTATSAGTALELGLYSARTFSLTFDDGPNAQFTPQVFAILQAKHVLATFFEIGWEVEAYPQITAAIAAAGDIVGNHTFSHPFLTSLGRGAFDFQIDRTTQLIWQATGRAPRCARPPYGATNAAIVSWLAAKGLAHVMWTVDTSDYRRPPSGQIVANVLANAAPGGIVLMHDGGGDRSNTVAAVADIIDGLRGMGYTLVPVCA
ncbi:MAG: polysaccharide deacetylase family protein [Acidimicrobiales bacterium]